MTTARTPVDSASAWQAREHEPLRHDAEFSKIEESLRAIHTTLGALRLEAGREMDGEEEGDEPRDEGGRR